MIDVRALRVATFLACVLPAFFAGTPAWGAYPDKAVRVIVPSPPGGGNDIMARLAGQKLSEAWGKQVLVDNRPGAGGAIAFEIAARAESNGYTLLLGSTNLTVLPDITKVNYDPIKDFRARLAHGDVDEHSARASLRAGEIDEGPDRACKGRIPASSTTRTSIATSVHLAAELFKAKAGVNIVMVPYKGMGPALVDLIAGHLDVAFANPAASHALRAIGPAAGAGRDRRKALLHAAGGADGSGGGDPGIRGEHVVGHTGSRGHAGRRRLGGQREARSSRSRSAT